MFSANSLVDPRTSTGCRITELKRPLAGRDAVLSGGVCGIGATAARFVAVHRADIVDADADAGASLSAWPPRTPPRLRGRRRESALSETGRWDNGEVAISSSASRPAVLRRGRMLEWITLAWNVIGVAVLTLLAAAASSVALAGFGLDSLIEIGASAVVLWELSGTGDERQRRALRLVGAAFVLLASYLAIQSTVALISGHHATPGLGGIGWTGVTAIVMFTLAVMKARTGRELGNPVLLTEARVTFIDGLLATAVLAGVSLDLLLGWWWADPIAGYVIVYYAIREAVHIFRPGTGTA